MPSQAKKLKYVHRMAWLVGGPALIVQGLFGWLPLAVGFVLAFQSMKYGKGAALSVTLFFVTMILVVIQRKYIKEDIDR